MATTRRVWSPAAPRTTPIELPDTYEVRVCPNTGATILVGATELLWEASYQEACRRRRLA